MLCVNMHAPHTYIHTHTRMHARTHARTHTHTHIQGTLFHNTDTHTTVCPATHLWQTVHVVLPRGHRHTRVGEDALAARLTAEEGSSVRLWTHDRHFEVVRDEDVIVVRNLSDDVSLTTSDQVLEALQRARTVLEDGGQAHVVTL